MTRRNDALFKSLLATYHFYPIPINLFFLCLPLAGMPQPTGSFQVPQQLRTGQQPDPQRNGLMLGAPALYISDDLLVYHSHNSKRLKFIHRIGHVYVRSPEGRILTYFFIFLEASRYSTN